MFLYMRNLSYFLGGNPKHDRIGFRYWRAPDGPMGKYLLDQVKNESLSIFLGFWATLTNALFAYMGTELIGVRAQDVDLVVFHLSSSLRLLSERLEKIFLRLVLKTNLFSG